MTRKDKKTIGLISLGCDKNRVDSEKMLAFLSDEFNISNNPNECDILIINTCAFLAASREEAISTVFDFIHLKDGGKLEKIIMTGCLPQKFIDELFFELIEVDAFLGTYDQTLLKDTIKRVYNGERVNAVGQGSEIKIQRYLTTPPHYAYLKISDGCNNFCTYCLIPKIRGKLKSYPIDELVEEAKGLGDGIELILVAQDTTGYGEDSGENKLVELIKSLSNLENINSIRLLYCYPEKITDELINELKNNDKLIKYIDIPLQHADDKILKLMNRRGSFEGYLELIEKLKAEIPSIAIRSTFISGFPSETEVEHQRLIEFLKKARLTNAGFFAYSKEPGTPAFKLKGHLPEKVKQKRVRELYAVQAEISKDNLKSYKGKIIEVVCDGIDYEKQAFFGRAYFSAPDVDPRVYFSSEGTINQGEKYSVKITHTEQFDLFGEIVK